MDGKVSLLPTFYQGRLFFSGPVVFLRQSSLGEKVLFFGILFIFYINLKLAYFLQNQ
jgi:hypothetical protein